LGWGVRVHGRGVNFEVGQGEGDIPLPLGESAEEISRAVEDLARLADDLTDIITKMQTC